MKYSFTKQVVNQFLYGANTTPNLLDFGITNKAHAGVVNISLNDLMNENTGAGRFAVGSQFGLINLFFDKNFATIPPGTYTKLEIAEQLGYAFDPNTNLPILPLYEVIKQYDYQDNYDDYAERTLIFNSMLFMIDDGASFVVDANGNRYIENYAIKPVLNDNFDFNSSDGLASVLNPYLEKTIDPSGIGHTVLLNFTGTVQTKTYTEFDYLHDVNKQSNWSGLDTGKLESDGVNILNELWNSGITKFLDNNDRPIIYGTNGADNLNGSNNSNIWSVINNLIGVSNIGDYKNNGVVIFGGNGIDTITGSNKSDVLYGGLGVDTINGGTGNDLIFADERYYSDASTNTLDGGGGRDELVGGAGKDTFIWNQSYDDRIVIWGNGGNDIIKLVGMDADDLMGKYTKSGHAYIYASGSDSFIYLPKFQSDPGKPIYFQNPDNTLVQITTVFDEEEEPMDDPSGGDPYNPFGGRGPLEPAPYADDARDGMDNANGAEYPRLDGSPLVIDMDGDGVELTNLNNGSVYWDIDNDGMAEASAWVKADDALLAIDLNNDGTINNHGELFGTQTTDGFTVLTAYDTNYDNVIDANDTDFSKLLIWQDLNQDGKTINLYYRK